MAPHLFCPFHDGGLSLNLFFQSTINHYSRDSLLCMMDRTFMHASELFLVGFIRKSNVFKHTLLSMDLAKCPASVSLISLLDKSSIRRCETSHVSRVFAKLRADKLPSEFEATFNAVNGVRGINPSKRYSPPSSHSRFKRRSSCRSERFTRKTLAK